MASIPDSLPIFGPENEAEPNNGGGLANGGGEDVESQQQPVEEDLIEAQRRELNYLRAEVSSLRRTVQSTVAAKLVKPIEWRRRRFDETQDWIAHQALLLQDIDANPGLNEKQQSKYILDSIADEIRGLAYVGWNDPKQMPPPGRIYSLMSEAFPKTKGIEGEDYQSWTQIFQELEQQEHEGISAYVARVNLVRNQYISSNAYNLEDLSRADSALVYAYTKRTREPWLTRIGELAAGWKDGTISNRPKTAQKMLVALGVKLMSLKDLDGNLQRKKQEKPVNNQKSDKSSDKKAA
jgi:hypothetical protein